MRVTSDDNNNSGNYSLAAKCWLSQGRGTEAGDCLARLGDRHALRLAAMVTGETVLLKSYRYLFQISNK